MIPTILKLRVGDEIKDDRDELGRVTDFRRASVVVRFEDLDETADLADADLARCVLVEGGQ